MFLVTDTFSTDTAPALIRFSELLHHSVGGAYRLSLSSRMYFIVQSRRSQIFLTCLMTGVTESARAEFKLHLIADSISWLASGSTGLNNSKIVSRHIAFRSLASLSEVGVASVMLVLVREAWPLSMFLLEMEVWPFCLFFLVIEVWSFVVSVVVMEVWHMHLSVLENEV